MSEHVLNMAGVTVLCQHDNAYGVWTTPGIPQMYVFRFSDLLSHGAVFYHDKLISVNPFLTKNTPAEKIVIAKKELERQLRSFRRVNLLPKSLNARITVSFSGKIGKDNQRTASLKVRPRAHCVGGAALPQTPWLPAVFYSNLSLILCANSICCPAHLVHGPKAREPGGLGACNAPRMTCAWRFLLACIGADSTRIIWFRNGDFSDDFYGRMACQLRQLFGRIVVDRLLCSWLRQNAKAEMMERRRN